MYYGFTVTDKGRALIAKLVAGRLLSISRIMVGSGACPDNQLPREMTDLAEPVAAATSTVPTYDGAQVSFVIEYRSDLNGGLPNGFWLREFGVFAYDPDDGEVLIYYGCLGDYPQWVSAVSANGVDVRRFPVSIVIGDESGVQVDFNCAAWMTAEDVEQYLAMYLTTKIVPTIEALIAQHNNDPDAHPDIQNAINELAARITALELAITVPPDVTPLSVTFATLDGLEVQGVWNETRQRIEF